MPETINIPFSSSITSQGQVTLPALVRKHLGVTAKQKVAFVIEANGDVKVVTSKYPTIASLRGAAGSLGKKLSIKKMKEIAYAERFH